jgi:hypothetical protein
VKRWVATAVAALVGVWLAAALASCGSPPNACISRGDTTTTEGSATYSRGSNDGPLVRGSVEAWVVAYDITPGCWYTDMQFKVVVGSCTLWFQTPADAGGQYADAESDSGVVTAVALPGETCVLPLSDGSVTVRSMTATFEIGPPLLLSIAGEVTAMGASEVTPAESLSWSYQGN